MKEKRSFIRRFERNMRLVLSDFFSLFTPGERKVFTWAEILIGTLIISFLFTITAIFL
jgi:hypothetical protein